MRAILSGRILTGSILTPVTERINLETDEIVAGYVTWSIAEDSRILKYLLTHPQARVPGSADPKMLASREVDGVAWQLVLEQLNKARAAFRSAAAGGPIVDPGPVSVNFEERFPHIDPTT
jgi:hypothetical protein